MNARALMVAMFTISLFGCASTGQNASDAKDYSKAEKKISMAIGEDVGSFKITERVDGDSAPVGFSQGIYTVVTRNGTRYKCSVLEASSVMNVLSFGGAGSADATCTNFSRSSKAPEPASAPNCNDLLRAARKC